MSDFLRAILLALGVATFGLLAGITVIGGDCCRLAVGIHGHPAVVLAILTILYTAAAVGFWRKLQYSAAG